MRTASTTAVLLSALNLPSLISAVALDCKHIILDEKKFNINPLAGEHSVSYARDSGVEDRQTNTTFLFNLCAPLKLTRDSKEESGCRHGSWGELLTIGPASSGSGPISMLTIDTCSLCV